ncbi:DUF805 domain-containing protein [Dongia sp.]|uniref:DUF805 domain-containing protein n=1 Tax=Dongia sp. TaxID=1977262 RepID=UPI003752BC4E
MLFALFSWGSRMGRLSYFGYSVLLGIVLVVLGLILLLPLRNATNAQGVTIAIVLILVAMAIWGGFCLAAKRLHDINLSAWHYAWMIVVPAICNGLGAAMQETMKVPGLTLIIIGGVISLSVGLFLLLWPGTDGPNDYGERE